MLHILRNLVQNLLILTVEMKKVERGSLTVQSHLSPGFFECHPGSSAPPGRVLRYRLCRGVLKFWGSLPPILSDGNSVNDLSLLVERIEESILVILASPRGHPLHRHPWLRGFWKPIGPTPGDMVFMGESGLLRGKPENRSASQPNQAGFKTRAIPAGQRRGEKLTKI